MPELAEVEYVARQLQQELPGKIITAVDVAIARTIIHPAPEEWTKRLCGQQIHSIGRRGKYLLVHLVTGETLVIHRRMTGNLTLVATDIPDEPYLCVTCYLSDGRRLLYTDPRKFGHMGLYTSDELAALFAKLGPEPFSDDFTPAVLTAICHSSSRTIKAVLLDQHCIAGLGNIYTDEALFAASIHPLRPAHFLTLVEINRLHQAIRDVLMIGIEHGGTTFGRHRDAFGEAGTNLDHIQVYQRTGQACHRCGTIILRIIVEQRGTHVCPQCQQH